jgi:hypothetical protein
MNHESSRSHSILTISVNQHLGSGETLRVGKIRLVDLVRLAQFSTVQNGLQSCSVHVRLG